MFWYVVSRALDRLDGLRVFAPSPAGQSQVWTELGYRHPLSAQLKPPEEGLVLVQGDGPWWRLPKGTWTDVGALVSPSGLEVKEPTRTEPAPPRITVPLKLGRAARRDAPTLYLVPGGREKVEALVRGTPEAGLDHLLFAVAGELVLLRVRPGHEDAGAALPGEPYARVAELPNLFAPLGLTVEPPLRRDRLREWLAPDPERVVWLTPEDAGPSASLGTGLSAHSVDEAAFRPLTEWVDYVLGGAREALTAWAKSAVFSFEPFAVAQELVPRAPVEAPVPQPSPRPPPPSSSSPRPRAESEAPRPSAPEERPSAPQVHLAPTAAPSDEEQALAREEAAFLESEAAPDAPERRAAWVRLAEAYGRAQRYRDAGQAWAMAVWTAPADEAPALARRWADTSPVRFDAALSLTAPTVEQTRGVVAHLLAASLAGGGVPAASVAEWASFLDRFDADLDVRSVWLGRQAVSRLSGGDTLFLARARDRVLARLQRGLSLERDVPRLLRLVGRGAGGLSERVQQVAKQLETVLHAIETTPRKRTSIEAPPQLTNAYVELEFAWGFARLGLAERAKELRDAATAALDTSDDLHAWLVHAYGARIDQALDGASPDTPLPADVGARLNALESFLRYKVDKLRNASQVLVPGSEHADVYGRFVRLRTGARGEELAALRGLGDPKELLKQLEARVEVVQDPKLSGDERARMIDGLLDFLPALPESSAVPLLARLVAEAERLPAAQKLPVLEDALMVAGHFGRTQLVQRYVKIVSSLLQELGSEGVAELGATLTAGVRSLRRVGLRDEARELLARAGGVLKGEGVGLLQARLALATGFAYLGAWERAVPTVEEAFAELARESGPLVPNRLKVTRAVARTLAAGPTDEALSGLRRLLQQLPWITDSYNTNDHFCLSVVEFADALVLGHVGDDLTLAEPARRFLEEDEHLVRLRVHRDVEVAH